MLQNNYHCTEPECNYRTNKKTEELADIQLVLDGGYDIDKKTMCPKCGKDSLVFISA